MDLAECDWYPAAAGTDVQLWATDSPAVRINESQAPIRPATRTWGVMITRRPGSQSGHDLPDAIVRELAADGGPVSHQQRIPAERLKAAAERAPPRGSRLRPSAAPAQSRPPGRAR